MKHSDSHFLSALITLGALCCPLLTPGHCQEKPEIPAANAARAADAVTAEEPQAEEAPQRDRTDEILEKMKAEGVEQLAEKQVGDMRLFLGITRAADRIIERGMWDVPGNGVNLEQMQKVLMEEFSDSLTYLQKLLPDAKARHIYVAIDDFGDTRQIMSGAAKVNSRIILMDIRRLHKNLARRRLSHLVTTSVHELTHVLTYERDWDETKYHRELTGVLLEQIHYIRRYGEKRFSDSYLSETTAPLRDAPAEASKVMRDSWEANTPLRYILYNFLNNVGQGLYEVPEKDKGRKASTLERLAVAYIKSEKHGDEGFNEACEQAGFTVDGAPLTLQRMRQDCRDALLR